MQQTTKADSILDAVPWRHLLPLKLRAKLCTQRTGQPNNFLSQVCLGYSAIQ